jgi:hypothetical protein
VATGRKGRESRFRPKLGRRCANHLFFAVDRRWPGGTTARDEKLVADECSKEPLKASGWGRTKGQAMGYAFAWFMDLEGEDEAPSHIVLAVPFPHFEGTAPGGYYSTPI